MLWLALAQKTVLWRVRELTWIVLCARHCQSLEGFFLLTSCVCRFQEVFGYFIHRDNPLHIRRRITKSSDGDRFQELQSCGWGNGWKSGPNRFIHFCILTNHIFVLVYGMQERKREEHELVTHGIYGICRHPSYLGWWIFAVGTQVRLNPFGHFSLISCTHA